MTSFPASWPPRPASGVRSIRFYATGTATSNFVDNAFMFAEQAGANTFVSTPYVPPGGVNVQASVGDLTAPGSPMGGGRNANDSQSDPHTSYGNTVTNPTTAIAPPPRTQIWAKVIRIINASGNLLSYSFDGTNVHGVVQPNSESHDFDRYESGIAVKGSGTFYIVAW